ncbi:hypothetical protein BDZ89DRAFT_671367 [Hymenopellis radicata]|nr:hypothetical protein BDZ89DRAFT_671367 [Hymenopellis radicata]
MASVPLPQRAAITELTGSGLSVTAFWLILCSANAPAVYFYLIPRFWPGYIVASTLERCKEAKGSLKDIPLERLTDQPGPDMLSRGEDTPPLSPRLPDEARRLRSLVRALKGLYKEARALSAEMDEVTLKLDQSA